MAETAAPLKRVEFVRDYAAQATGVAEKVYKTARGFVPAFVEPYLVQLEETAINVGAPYLTLAQDSAEKLLQGLDTQVDYSLNTVSGAISYSRDLHEKQMTTFKGTKDQYYGYVTSTVNQAKSLVDPTPYVESAVSASKWVASYVDPDKIVDTGVEVAGKVASFGPVPKVLEIGEPIISTGVKTYESVHDTLVSLPLYKTLWDLLFSTTASLQEAWPVKKAIEVAGPVVSPVAEPIVTNFTNSKYLKQLETHLKPVAA